MTNWRLKIVLATVTVLSCGASWAAYPERPIRIIVPFAAGGSADAGARAIGNALSAQLAGASVIIENRVGAGGLIGANVVAHAAPDGYTLLLTSNSISAAPSMPNVQFDIRKDFTPISKTISSQFTIVVNAAKSPVRSFGELLAYMRANPGKLDFASPGPMTSGHFALEEFKLASGLSFNIIQYNGNAPASMAVMAGEPPAGIDGALTAKAAVVSGRLRALAATGMRRSPALPDVPTISEAGLPGFEAGFSLVLLGPAKMQKPVVDQIYQALAKAFKDPEVIKQVEGLGFDVVGSGPDEYKASLEKEIVNSAKVMEKIRASGGSQ